MRLKICVSHLTWKVANKCLNVCERVEVEERNRNDPLPSPAVMCIVSVRGENPHRKKGNLIGPCIPQQDVSMEFSLKIERYQCFYRSWL